MFGRTETCNLALLQLVNFVTTKFHLVGQKLWDIQCLLTFRSTLPKGTYRTVYFCALNPSTVQSCTVPVQ